MKLGYKYGDTEALTETDLSIMQYYGYLKINKGVTYEEFVTEKAYVINTILALKTIEIEDQEKELKKAKRKNGK